MNRVILLLPPCAFTEWATTFLFFIFGGVLTGIDRYCQVFSRQFDSLLCHGGTAVRRKLRKTSAPPWNVQRGRGCCSLSNDSQENMTGTNTQGGSSIYERKFPSFQFQNTYLTLKHPLSAHALASHRCKTYPHSETC
jgi:hypothetical protein